MINISKERIERNKELVEKEFYHLIEEGIKHTEEQIGNLFKGRWSFILNPLAKVVFSWFAIDRAKEAGLKQLRFALKCAEQCINKSVPEVVNQYFSSYLKYNLVYLRSNHRHQDYPKLQELMKEGFKIRLILYSTILKAKGKEYEELLKNAFPSKKEVVKLVEEQFKVVQSAQELVEEEPLLIKIPPLARKEILHILKSAYSEEKRLLLKRIDQIYQLNNPNVHE